MNHGNPIICPSTSEESDSQSYICIPKPTKAWISYPKYFFNLKPNEISRLLDQYKIQHARFSLTQRAELMLIRIINRAHFQKEYQHYPMIKLLTEISCEMMMSEVELAAFSIFLQRLVWPCTINNLMIMLYTVAFAVKFKFSSNLEQLLAYLNEKIPGFIQFLSNWMNQFDEMVEVDLGEVNKVFSELTRQPFDDIMNYNYYVDIILEMAPSSVYEKPTWQEQAMPILLETRSEHPGFVKFDSLFGEFEIPVMNSGFSVMSSVRLISNESDF